jgi:uncharacterized C2H2 Zn-finger protein
VKWNIGSDNQTQEPPNTKAGQYMCPECGQIFDTKKEVDSHFQMIHNPNRTQRMVKFIGNS